jgi:hypothetical protein
MSYTRGLLVRAVDPLTRGALRARVMLLGSAVHLRSFLDGAAPAGHTIKGSGLVAFASNRWNTTSCPMERALQRECDKHMRSLGVHASDYDFGEVRELDAKAVVFINGRRYTLIRNIFPNQENSLYILNNLYIILKMYNILDILFKSLNSLQTFRVIFTYSPQNS